MKKWKCSVCDYVHEGDNPPVECPHCESIVGVFSEQIDKKEKGNGQKWDSTQDWIMSIVQFDKKFQFKAIGEALKIYASWLWL